VSDLQRDNDLKARFQELRSESRGSAPDFAAMMARVKAEAEAGAQGESGMDAPSRKRSGRRKGRWAWAGGSLAAAAAAAGLLFFSPSARADRDFERTVRSYTDAAGSWRSPTDRLLRVPGSEITRSIPSIGIPNTPSGASRAPRSDRS